MSAVALLGILGMSSSIAAVLYTVSLRDEEGVTSPTVSTARATVFAPGELEPSNCEGTTMILKKACHLPTTGELLDGTEKLCGLGKEEYVPDPNAPGYVAAVGEGACPSTLKDCEVPCPVPCSGGAWVPTEGDFCKIIAYDDSNPPQKIETALDGTTTCGTGVISETLDESQNNFIEAQGAGTCVKQRIGSCDVACPAGMTASSGCAYYADRQKSANGCMKLDDPTKNVECGEAGKQEYFYLPISSSTCNKLSEWEPCMGEPCPVDCIGDWRQTSATNPEGWEECVGSCGTQPEKKRVYQITRDAAYGGQACPHADGYEEKTNCGSVEPCCELGNWSGVTSCGTDGFQKQTRTMTERSPGACSGQDAQRDVRCCYEGTDWNTTGSCGTYESGKQKYTQTTAGNCPTGTETKYEDCAPCVYKEQRTTNKYCKSTSRGHYWVHGQRNVIINEAVGTGTACPEENIRANLYNGIATSNPRETCDARVDTPKYYDQDSSFPGATWVDV